MSLSDKTVDLISELLTGLIPKPADALAKPIVKQAAEGLKSWLGEGKTREDLRQAAERAESNFRSEAKTKFGNDELTQAVASFPIHNVELFQAALQSLPDHLDETVLSEDVQDLIGQYWTGKFSKEEISAGTALYMDCLRLQLLHVEGFKEIVTQLAILRTDRGVQEILVILPQMMELLNKLMVGREAHTGVQRLFQIPPPPADFTGREVDIAAILADFEQHKGAAISGLTGTGGIGKTALGFALAARLADKYPDAKITLDLKGTTEPLPAEDILRHVILSFEPGADLRGADAEALRGVYLSVLRGKKALLFYDNARSAAQVEPLRPPEGCGMLVTSRWTFPVPGLKDHRLGLLEMEAARAFLLELCPRIGAHAEEIANACGRLPLALKIAGSFLKINPGWPVDEYAKKLRECKDRLHELKTAHAGAEMTADPDLEAAFDLSYAQLAEEGQARWRKLGVFPAPFTAEAAGAVWGLEEAEYRTVLGLLARCSLIEYDEKNGRYWLHDLLAEFALAHLEEGEEETARLAHAEHYKNVLAVADYLILKGGENILPGLALFDAEWVNIQVGQKWASSRLETEEKAASLCRDFANAGAYCLELRLQPHDWLEWLDSALTGARRLGDRGGESTALSSLGSAFLSLAEPRKAIESYEKQLLIVREISDRHGEGNALSGIGLAYDALGEPLKALMSHEKHLLIVREIGDRRGEGNALGNLGNVHLRHGGLHKAIEYLEKQLTITREIGDRPKEGNALNNLGNAYARLGEPRKAIESYKKQLVIAHEIGDRGGEASGSWNLGLAYEKEGEIKRAIEAMQVCVDYERQIGHPDAEKDAARIDELRKKLK